MKIETKMNITDEVFFLFDKKVIKSVVQGIKIQVGADKIEITYLCNNEADKPVNLKVDEKDAFKTKKQLIESL